MLKNEYIERQFFTNGKVVAAINENGIRISSEIGDVTDFFKFICGDCPVGRVVIDKTEMKAGGQPIFKSIFCRPRDISKVNCMET